MRISDNNLVTQVNQVAIKETSGSLTPPKVGDVLNAVVAELLQKGVLLNLEGHLVKANVKNPANFQVGEEVFLKVTRSDSKQLLVEKTLDPKGLETAAKSVDVLSETLKTLNLPDTQKNRSALEALNSFKNPLTQANVKTLQVMQSALEMLMKQPPEQLAAQSQLKGFLEMGIKEIAVALQKSLAQNAAQPASSAPLEAAPSLQGQVMQGSQKPTVPPSTTVLQNSQFPVDTDAALKTDLKIQLPQTGEIQIQKQVPTLQNKAELTEHSKLSTPVIAQNTEATQNLRELTAKQVNVLFHGLEALKDPKESLKTLSFLMKLEIPPTPQSLFAVGQVFNRTHLKSLLNDLFSVQGNTLQPDAVAKGIEALKSLLNDFQPEIFKSQENLQELTKKLIETAQLLEQSSHKSTLQVQDMSWANKAVTDIFKMTNLPFILSQYPLMINDKLETMELYVEKRQRGKKINPEDLRIYVSLTTEKLGQVGAMIEIQMKNINITFDASSEKIKDFIAFHGTDLADQLEPLGYHVTVKAEVKSKPTHLIDLQEQFEPVDFKRFDRKV